MRPFAGIQTEDQWLRASHAATAFTGGAAQLAWEEEEEIAPTAGQAPSPAGLAFDSYCRLYRSLPKQGRIERLLWAAQNPLQPTVAETPDESLLLAGPVDPVGEFEPVAPATPFQTPRGIAVDADDRLFICESGARRITVIDLWSWRVLRRIAFAGRPMDVASGPGGVFVVTQEPAELWNVDARREARRRTLPSSVEEPSRVAVSPTGEVFVLDRAASEDANVVSETREIPSPFATDIAFLEKTPPVLVIAHLPGQDFFRKQVDAGAVSKLPPLKGKGYNGRGIVRTPDGRIGFWTDNGFRHAVVARLKFRPKGKVVGFRLDSGNFQTRWGRLFLDACIPKETSVRVRCITLDDAPPDTEPPVPRILPANFDSAAIFRPELSAPLPPLALVDVPTPQDLFRRENGRELPWARPAADDPFETYEAPVIAAPGRFLWVVLEFTGNSRSTPRVRSVRAEYPGHDHLRRLPKLYSRDAESADFLRRYLAMPDGALSEIEGKAAARHALIDPRSAPAETLPWLAGFLGLVLDERWPERARRAAIAEATWLFRFRGTIRGLRRFIEIYLGVASDAGPGVVIVEKFRFRGIGSVGDETAPNSRSILGAGFRVGGEIGDITDTPIAGDAADAFDTHAHRFSVMIPAAVTGEQLDVVRHILEVHRPAHTMYDLCTAAGGMRVGRGLHIGMTAVIGRTGGFAEWQVGETSLGRNAVLGRPEAGTRPEAARLGLDSHVG